MKVKLSHLDEARRFWRTIAVDNGWGDVFDTGSEIDFTLWVDPEGNVTDSVATRTGGGCIYLEEHHDRTS